MAETYKQMDIFSFLQSMEENSVDKNMAFCWDSDINEIHSKLLSLAEKYALQIQEDEFTVWSHVPQYGYRLYLAMKVTKELLQDNNFLRDIAEITEFSTERDVELSCMMGGCFFFQGENTAKLPFCTTFIDKARRKIKNF